MHSSGSRYTLLSIVAIFIFITFMMPGLPGFLGDMGYWKNWGKYIFSHGLCNAYGSDSNYMPLYQYFLWLFGLLAGSEQAIDERINYLRCFTLVFEFWGLWLVYKWADLQTGFLTVLCIGLMNIAYSYNTIIWGQVDAIVATFIFAALYAAGQGRLFISGLALVLAINMKLQAIVFLPVWGLLVLGGIFSGATWRKIGALLGGMATLQLLIILPFSFGPGGIKPIWNVVINSANFYPVVSMNAYNFWSWFIPNPIDVSDRIKILNLLTYNHAGLLFFFSMSFLAMLPMIRTLFRQLKKEKNVALFTKEEIWLTTALIALLFFFCNTQMHERYAHPAFIFITAYAFYSRQFLSYGLFSIAYFLNLEGVQKWLHLPKYSTLIFDSRFVAGLFAIVITDLFLKLYSSQRRAAIAA